MPAHRPRPASRPATGRRFVIHSEDPRARRAIRRSPATGEERCRAEALARTRTAIQEATNSALAIGKEITNKSQWAYWTEFCSLFDFDTAGFGSLAPGQVAPSLDKLRQEEETLSAFMALVVACPRKSKKNNTANYSLQSISKVRSHYALSKGRRPGLREGNKAGGQLKAVIRGFQKTHPSTKLPRIPIMQQHLREIRNQLDLQNNRLHKALWALWLTQWQGALGSSDLIKKARDAGGPWLPANETHRERLAVDTAVWPAKDKRGKPSEPDSRCALTPTKRTRRGATAQPNPSSLTANHKRSPPARRLEKCFPWMTWTT